MSSSSGVSHATELRVGGRTYRVVASVDDATLQRLAESLNERLRALAAPGRSSSSNDLVLVALRLVHELEQETSRRLELEQRLRQFLSGVLSRIDAALRTLERQQPSPCSPS